MKTYIMDWNLNKFFVKIGKLNLKLYWKGPNRAKIIFKKTKLEDLYYLVLRLVIKVQK